MILNKFITAFYDNLNLHRPSSKHIAQCSRNSNGMSLARRYSTKSPESSSAGWSCFCAEWLLLAHGLVSLKAEEEADADGAMIAKECFAGADVKP